MSAVRWPDWGFVYVPFEILNDTTRQVDVAHVWPMVVWAVKPGEKVSKIITQACEEFTRHTGIDPDMALVRTIPPGAQEGVMVKTATLTVADWVQPGYVAVCQSQTKAEVLWKTKK